MLKRGELLHRWYIKLRMTGFNRKLRKKDKDIELRVLCRERCGAWRCICDIYSGKQKWGSVNQAQGNNKQ